MYNSEQHYNHLYSTTPREFEFCAESEEELTNWQEAFRDRLRQALGLHNIEMDLSHHQPAAEMLKSEDMGDHIREEWYLWVEPTVPLPFYLLRPKEHNKGLPLALTPHGHNHPHIYVGIARNQKEEKEITEGERDIACQAVRQGYLTIAPTTRAFGETRTTIDRNNDKGNSCRTALMHGLLVGRTPIGERVWDMSRLIDWAIAEQHIDAKRIVITGNSGGGTVSLHAAACDTRITVAVPSCYFCTYQGSLGSIAHCDCNYIPGILRMGEMYEVAGLIAPRPFSAIAGKEDGIFPIDQVKYAFEKLQKIYQVANAPNNCYLHIGEGGHRYYKAGAWDFVQKHFNQIEN